MRNARVQVVKAALLNECTLLCAFSNEVCTTSPPYRVRSL